MSTEVCGMCHYGWLTFQRPNDTNAYTALDAVSDSTSAPTPFVFTPEITAASGSGVINQAACYSSANQATKPDIDLFIFERAPAVINDNAAFTVTDAELLTCVARINFPATSWTSGNATAGAGGNSFCIIQNTGIPVNFQPKTAAIANAGSTGMFALVRVNNAYTPVAQEQFSFRLSVAD